MMGHEDRAEQTEQRTEVLDRIAEFRAQIDAIDEQLVRLLNERARRALGLGSLKESIGQEIYQPDREIAVLEHARRVNGGPLLESAITRLFERIIDENRRLERCADSPEVEDTPEPHRRR